ncbi:hypothetical protein [Salibacter halophilus]|uniref:Lipoprotein n=1 Tax=Salibacter halophilus TaxID=1803916 RepID=A0A6N6M6Q1_9FLAO|nr:hypothetical protein [Salibacter halophilus]KAB1064092.1 hypothetical protein F3059_08660 [Salibacter halophilus]
MNLKTCFSLLSLVLIFASCALLMPEEKRQCYRKLKDFAKENWKFSNHDSILVEDSTLFHSVIRMGGISDCAVGMQPKEIKRIFGTPHEIVKTKHKSTKRVARFYYFTVFCYPSVSKVNFCSYYSFDFNKKGECTSFDAGGFQKEVCGDGSG